MASPALTRLFERTNSLRGGKRELIGGETLFEAGEPADRLYLLKSGRLAVTGTRVDGSRHVIRIIRPGEAVGEMALLDGTPRRYRVAALRDSSLGWLPANAFFAAARRDPAVMGEIARLVLLRNRAGQTPARAGARAILIAALGDGVDPVALATALAREIGALGFSALALSSEGLQRVLGDRLAQAEARHDYVLLAGQAGQDAWIEDCRRQADRVLLLGLGSEPPPPECVLCDSEPLQANRLIDLVLAWPDAKGREAADLWLNATGAARLFHVGPGSIGHARLARILTGTSVGLTLSGGGARAFAHVGVVRAFREAGVPIDFVGGTSMGAIIAAGVAANWDDHELDWRMRRAFVNSNPLDDVAFPTVAMTRGGKVRARLAEHFGAGTISALDLPFFCVSANLTTGQHVRHDRGSVVTALRASIALPGILPPVIHEGEVLVDGGILRNLPTDLMARTHDGPVVGSDVTRAGSIGAADVMPPPSWPRWFWSGSWRRGPPIVSILMRSATLATGAEHALARDASDLYIMPELTGIEIRDWRAYPAAVEAGYRAATEALGALSGPLTHLRHARGSGQSHGGAG